MIDITRITEEDFFQWIKMQLEKREFMNGCRFEKTKMKEELYELLFYEQRLTVEEIEQFFIPFGQAGYLSPRKKFEIMLFVLEKEYGRSYLFVEGKRQEDVVTEEDIEEAYLQWSLEERLYLSDEEKKEFFIQNIMDRLGLGVLEVLDRMDPDGILIGELCPARYEQEQAEERVAICFGNFVIHFPFLEIESREELIRIVKYTVALENRGELTVMEPILDYVREDGTCMTAVRPPAARNWGVRVLYGAASKEGVGWRR